MNSLIKTDKTRSKAFSCRELKLLVKGKSVAIQPFIRFYPCQMPLFGRCISCTIFAVEQSAPCWRVVRSFRLILHGFDVIIPVTFRGKALVK
jgi:hypothetical protein